MGNKLRHGLVPYYNYYALDLVVCLTILGIRLCTFITEFLEMARLQETLYLCNYSALQQCHSYPY